MSLALVQGYSSSEEEEEAEEGQNGLHYHNSSDDDGDGVEHKLASSSVYESSRPTASNTSALPSASDAFSEISGPPAFLNNCVQEYSPQQVRHDARHNKHRKEKKDLPAGAVVESKAHLVGIHERVRSDLDGKQPPTVADASTNQGGKRVATVTNPSAEDAAALLRMCLQCGIPKTFSNARGMVCPACGDRPVEATDDSKKKGSTIKDKEKNKRMKGQSSHATWKSETEMQLRQQFD
ncbi:hypothetical protein RchiOBHm_Chr6g0273461 [Rosa chinensis]|uniref:Uncharacterized protein n=1 Tax=Rosa chinensis TaxID=74649 RepID=A0A2P6PRJ1_ROSCH|nr:uncharacterized protein LOC112168854 [Rosa chinensis]XP_040365749.1 uncharacterized protein LOC112168854 [Rosa chinensis]PRQ24532.1 hypothetical protein RchiOBHm_Chr6g0273461 [Rosa chinensis]